MHHPKLAIKSSNQQIATKAVSFSNNDTFRCIKMIYACFAQAQFDFFMCSQKPILSELWAKNSGLTPQNYWDFWKSNSST